MDTGRIAWERVLYCSEVKRNCQLYAPGRGYQRVLSVVMRQGYRSCGPWAIRLFRVYRSVSPKKGLHCTFCCREIPFTTVCLEAMDFSSSRHLQFVIGSAVSEWMAGASGGAAKTIPG